jgi:hypothetical protein
MGEMVFRQVRSSTGVIPQLQRRHVWIVVHNMLDSDFE